MLLIDMPAVGVGMFTDQAVAHTLVRVEVADVLLHVLGTKMAIRSS
jgi:hypothetical protein